MTRSTHIKVFDFLYHIYRGWPLFYSNLTQLLSVGQWEKWQDKVFEDLSGKKVLEIGVGPGKLLLRMAKKGYDVTGLEVARQMAYEARKRIRKAGFEIDIISHSVYHMPFSDGTFDAIVMTFVLGEIHDLDRAIEEMKRVLKPKMKIIVIAGGMPQDRNIVARFLFGAIQKQTTLHLERDNVEYFTKHGFSVKRTDFGPFNIVTKIVAVKQ